MTGHRQWQWQELAWDSPISPALATTALERLTTATELGPLVLELRADASGAHWVVGTQTGRPGLAALLSNHLPVRLHRPEQPRLPMTRAVRVMVRGWQVSHLPERVTAAVRALYAALSSLTGSQQVVLQLLVGRRLSPASLAETPPPSLWRQLLVGYDAAQSSARASKPVDEQHGAAVCLRLGYRGPSAEAHQRFAQLLGALRLVETAQSSVRLVAEATDKIDEARRPWCWPLRLRSGRLAALTGWPIGEAPLPLLGNLHPRRLPPSKPLLERRRVVGMTSAPGQAQPVGIAIVDAAYHTHLLGPTGAGKSTVMLALALADAAQGRGLLLIDPKGDLATDFLARLPEQRQRDVVVIDPSNPAPVGLNPLAGPPQLAPVTAEAMLSTFEALFREHWGIRTADVLSAALLTLARLPQATLLWLPPLLTDPAFRRWVLAQVPDDPLGTGAFWVAYNAKKPEAQATEIAPVLNKLRQLILRPYLRAVLGQAQPRFDLAELFTRRRIVVVNLNRGLLGAGAARLLGTVLVSRLWTLLLARQALPPEQRHIVSIFIDEAHEFIGGLPHDQSDALAQARSLGGAFHLAHQYRAQLSPAMMQAIESNARNKLYFGLSSTDAAAAARLAPELEAVDFQLLPAFHAYAQLMQRGQRSDWLSLTTQPAAARRRDPATLYAANHARYGVPAEQTEQALLTLTSSTSTSAPTSATDNDSPIGRRQR